MAASLALGSPLAAPAAGVAAAGNGAGAGPAPAVGSVARDEAPTAGLTAGDPAARGTGPADPAVPAAPAALPQPPGTTSLVSVSTARGFPNGVSGSPTISSSGRYVAFSSGASNLVSGGIPGSIAVYLRDRSKGTTIELPLPGGGRVPSGGQATAPSISADGSVVAFVYQGPPGLVASPVSVLIWDRATGKTSGINTIAIHGAVDQSRQPAVSGNGRYVAYTSDDSNLVPSDFNRAQDVFRYDRQSGQIDLVSVSLKGGSAAGGSYTPSISGDGSKVAFTSLGGSTLVPLDLGTSMAEVYVRDMNAGVTTLVSAPASGSVPDGASGEPSISDNGQFVAFSSQATNLVAGLVTVESAPYEVYRRDLNAGKTALVSAQTDGSPNMTASAEPGISRDGRMVAYAQLGSIVSIATSQRTATSILLRDMVASATVLITVNLSGAPSISLSIYPKVGGLGRYVTFASNATDLVASDLNDQPDVFIRDLPPVPRLAPTAINFGNSAVGLAAPPAAGVLSNAGWGPMTVQAATIGGTNPADFSVLNDGCVGTTLYRGSACTVTVGFTPLKRGSRTAILQIPENAPGSPRTARLAGVASKAQVVLDPPVGDQGIVTVATGDGFPPGAQVHLSWSLGITPTLPIVKADANGHWQLQVLVFHNDVTGSRNLVAEWAGGPQFPTVQVPMLVTIRSATPPGFGVGPADSPLKLLFRG